MSRLSSHGWLTPEHIVNWDPSSSSLNLLSFLLFLVFLLDLVCKDVVTEVAVEDVCVGVANLLQLLLVPISRYQKIQIGNIVHLKHDSEKVKLVHSDLMSPFSVVFVPVTEKIAFGASLLVHFGTIIHRNELGLVIHLGLFSAELGVGVGIKTQRVGTSAFPVTCSSVGNIF